MNTMIPNKVRFDVDIQDLPARATQISQKLDMMLTSGKNCGPVPVPLIHNNAAAKGACKPICSSAGQYWDGNWRHDSAGPNKRFSWCNCCN